MNTTITMGRHKIRWFVWAGDTKLPFESTMMGTWGWDAECSCGWASRTGGATRLSVKREVWGHKADNGIAAAYPWR